MIIHESDVSQQLTIVLGMSDGVDDGSELGWAESVGWIEMDGRDDTLG